MLRPCACPHQEVVGRLFESLRVYLRENPVGHVMAGRADISWGPDILGEPDVFVAPLDEVRTLDWSSVKDRRLVVEVLIPSSERYDRFTKRRLYQEQGISLYWAVDADRHEGEVWTPDARFPVVERERLTWHPAGAGKA